VNLLLEVLQVIVIADLDNPSAHGQVHGSGGTECWKCVPSKRQVNYSELDPAKNFYLNLQDVEEVLLVLQ
jgi:hypothetical protein